MTAKILSLTGPSGIGKGYVKSAIKTKFGAKDVPVYTTRERRETDDESRIFVSDAEFEIMYRRGQLVMVNSIFLDRYGFGVSEMGRLHSSEEDFVLELYVDNVAKFKDMFPSARMLAMRTESDELLITRLRRRGESPKSASERVIMLQYENRRIQEMRNTFDRVYDINDENEAQINNDILSYAGELFCHT